MTKKGNQKFWRMKIGIFLEREKLGKVSTESDKFSEIGGKSETGGNGRLPQEEWTPLLTHSLAWRIYSMNPLVIFSDVISDHDMGRGAPLIVMFEIEAA